ncbi:hypothetical protein ACJX0J_035474, partial [Zea mays]
MSDSLRIEILLYIKTYQNYDDTQRKNNKTHVKQGGANFFIKKNSYHLHWHSGCQFLL